MTKLFSSGIAASGDINRQEFIQEIEKAAKKGNAISFNRSITDEYLKDLLRDGSIFKERLSHITTCTTVWYRPGVFKAENWASLL